MIKIKFEKKYGFQRKPYPFVEGLEILAVLDSEFEKKNQTAIIFLELFNPKDKNFGYKGYFELGAGNGDFFLEWLEKTLIDEFPENRNEVKEMIGILEEEIAQQAVAIKEIPEKSNKPKKRLSIFISGMIVFLLLLGGAGTYLLVSNQTNSSANAVTADSFVDDLKLLDPNQLGEKYPDRLVEIAEYYKEQQNWEKLKLFQTFYPTPEAAFDLAFYEQDWDSVIQTDVTTLTEERKIMLCYAYIEKNMLSEAELLATKLDSKQLEQELDYAYLRQVGALIKEKNISEAEEIGKKIKSIDLQKEYLDAVDSASLMKEMIALYQKQKDTKNQEIWERRLNELGHVLEERRLEK
ncbi:MULTISPECIES: hypothetical protein [unclassified Enterococcus]|uniref:hypothetical protein n=1 Tax=unclassified Enterococcus TaxID=2608891 RepID=UPI003F25EEDB